MKRPLESSVTPPNISLVDREKNKWKKQETENQKQKINAKKTEL